MSLGSHPPGWASRSIADALRIGSLLGLAACPTVLVCAALVSETSVALLPFVAWHVGCALTALIVLWRDWDVRIAFAFFYLLLLADLLVTTSVHDPLVTVAVWLAYLTIAAPVLLLPARPAALFSFIAVAVLATTVVVLRPDWGPRLPFALVTVATGLWLAVHFMNSLLQSLVRRSDAEEAASESARQQVAVARSVAQALAEDARILHDSVMNTLSAIASGTARQLDTGTVRERCAKDVRTTEQLLAGRRMSGSIPEIIRNAATPVHRTGISDEELTRCTAQLDPTANHALAGAVAELIRNAAKHGRATRVTLDISREPGQLAVTVSDDGVGFDGRTIPGRGLAESVVRRVEEVGGRVVVHSAPGKGTRVRVTLDLERPSSDRGNPDVKDADLVVARIRRRGCWTWAWAITGAGVWIELANRPGQLTYSMLSVCLVAALCLVAQRATRHRHTLPSWVVLLLIVGLPLGYLLGFAGVGFGQDLPFLWNPIGLSPLLVALLMLGRTRTPLMIGVIAVTGSGVLAAAWSWPDDRATAVVAATAALTELVQLTGWLGFFVSIHKVGRRMVVAQRQAASDHQVAMSRNALTSARGRWLEAGVRDSMDLLARIADRDADPTDPAIRARCAEEERYLRQLTLISPDLFHLGDWLARALATARARSIRLTMRTGEIDVEKTAADRLGRFVIEALDRMPHGTEVTLGLFHRNGIHRLHLVGSFAPDRIDPLASSLPPGWQLTTTRLESQVLAAAVAPHPRHSREGSLSRPATT